MENFSVSTIQNPDDWRAMMRAIQRRQWTPRNRWHLILVRSPLLLIAAMLLFGMFWLHTDREILALAIGVLGTVLLLVGGSLIAQRGRVGRPAGLFLGPARFSFDAEGMRVERTGSEARLEWSRVDSVEQTAAHVLIWVGEYPVYAIPARDLSGGLDTGIVTTRLRHWIAAAKSGTTYTEIAPVQVETAPEPASVAPRISLRQELAAVGKQLVFIRANPDHLIGSDRAIGLLTAVVLAIWLPLDALIYTGPMEFMPEQVGGLAVVITGALALAWLLSRVSSPRIEFRRVLLIVVASMLIAIASSACFNLLAERWMWATLVMLSATAYACLYFKLALRTLTGVVQTRALLVGAAATMLFVLVIDRLYINPSLWFYTGDDDTALDGDTNYQDSWRELSDVQFGQQARIDSEVAAIAIHSAPGAQTYFVGFAGYGEQRVFAGEIGLAAKSVGKRFDTADRQVLLVNDRRDLTAHPLASVHALAYTLHSLGKIMDPEDVLFLALSSHGDDDATLSVSNAGTVPGALDVEELAAALQHSGIRWKIIVISACHAGSFIEGLADDHTIVLTAAAADRTSFGCSDDRDLTYFGEAFYRDALPKARSLRAAFDAARASIAQREKAEGVEASEPQAFYGAAIESKLAGVEAP